MKYFDQLVNQREVDPSVFLAEGCVVIGNVVIQQFASVWYNAVIRGDKDRIEIGERTNIQDGSILHVDPGFPLKIGNGCTVGHGAMLHGCTIDDNTLIGIKATVMNGAKIGKFCIVGAHALVTENMVIPDYSMVLGVPGKVKKTMGPEIEERIIRNAEVYVTESQKYMV